MTAKQAQTEYPVVAGSGELPGSSLNPLELIALLRSGAEATPRVLALDPAPTASGVGGADVEVVTLAAPDRRAALAGQGLRLAEEGDLYDYALLGGATITSADDAKGLIAELGRVCRVGVVVTPPGASAVEDLVSTGDWQALTIDWDQGGGHLLLLRSARPADGLDGALPHDDDQRARLQLAEARVRTLSMELGKTVGRAMRESMHRSRLEAELDRVRGWSRARRIYGSAVFSLRHRWAMGRRSRAATPSGSQGLEPVFFVVGRGKSGTSWLMRALDEHPEVLCKGEGRFFGDRSRIGSFEGRSMLASLLSSLELREWAARSAWTRGGEFPAEIEEVTGAAAERLIRSHAAGEGKRIGGDKTPLYGQGEVVAQISRACPTANVIHIIRDGRDVAVSAMHHVWNRAEQRQRELGPELAAKRDRHRSAEGRPTGEEESIFPDGFLEGVARSWTSITSEAIAQGRLLGDRYIDLRYERMLEDPHRELARIFAFLGADTSDDVVARCVERSSFERMSRRRIRPGKARSRGTEDPSSFFRKGIAGDWRNVFTAADRETYKAVAGQLLIELGYESDLDW